MVGVGNDKKAIGYQKKSLIWFIALALLLWGLCRAHASKQEQVPQALSSGNKEKEKKGEMQTLLQRPGDAPWAPIC